MASMQHPVRTSIFAILLLALSAPALHATSCSDESCGEVDLAMAESQEASGLNLFQTKMNVVKKTASDDSSLELSDDDEAQDNATAKKKPEEQAVPAEHKADKPKANTSEAGAVLAKEESHEKVSGYDFKEGVYLPEYAGGDAHPRSIAESSKRCSELGQACAGFTCVGNPALCTVRAKASFAQTTSSEISYLKAAKEETLSGKSNHTENHEDEEDFEYDGEEESLLQEDEDEEDDEDDEEDEEDEDDEDEEDAVEKHAALSDLPGSAELALDGESKI